ncbi:pyruvate/2-oxoglutarate dehydrogenase complex dihydrolipoamide dehydrogenase (E3) component [Kribbella rubisoli]|uniref:Pyruvate/2-oxoglutarate dehydrogenase complex dihydrolipoamide dehydrogenase (E3) component n=1 Tax=Kribbella rubisoli TaxID=3075929 RepID=A0A4Q7XA92_9ACTN|nr:2Fe-2S iron-sulfur cluster-binding protein [Kribbella rubisoli]RZU20004.1 pyruvate/2-oxoglutarate dehydrogenase complex dihydrolipoamide dehydrogenase (E3) component [Kribbella rubisoli]
MSAYLRPRSGDPSEVGAPPAVDVTVDGHPVTAHAGQTVAAVLLANGRDTWRTTRVHNRPRGTFCGIGACQDCLVTVNGLADVRACQRTIVTGDAITTQNGAVLPATSETETVVHSPMSAEVVVVGAGPAGVAAALAGAEAGAEVLLVDNGRAIGGQYNRQLPQEFAAHRPDRLQHEWKAFAAQREALSSHPRITYLPETSIWAIEDLRLWAQQGPADAAGRQPFPIDAKAVVLATGAYDRVLPFPGWDLPGVYTAGAAQALAKGQRIAIGQRVLVAGTGPFLLPVAESLLGVGADVVALLEANSLTTVRKGWSTDPLVAPSKLREAVGYGALLARHRVPLRHGWTVIAAHGTCHVEAVTIARLDSNWRPVPGSERRMDVDAVCVGFGFTANLELAVSARCNLTTGPDGGPAVAVDANQQTTTSGIYAAGELTGIGGAALSSAEGGLAGAAAAHRALGGESPSLDSTAVTRGRRRFAAALAKAYPVRDGWKSWSNADTIVCRCEEVTRGELETVAGERGLDDGRAMKLSSRAGLGMCQGRVCSRTVAALLAAPGDVPKPSMKRPIAVPVRLRDLAQAEEEL